jgi:hypothetical protein
MREYHFADLAILAALLKSLPNYHTKHTCIIIVRQEICARFDECSVSNFVWLTVAGRLQLLQRKDCGV